MLIKDGRLILKVGAETFILFASSLIWPMVDSYYVTLLFTVSMSIGKEGSSASVEAAHIVKRVQWLSESLYQERVLKLFEACNIESVKNAVQTYKEMGVLQAKSVFLLLSDKYRNDERQLAKLLDVVSQYRCQANLSDTLL
jgi:Glycerol-3-phosphate acyltransferase C-terminal region